MSSYDNWKLSNGQDKEEVFDVCDECGGEIYVGEEYIEVEYLTRLHEDCYKKYAEKVLEPRKKVAE